MQAFQESLDIVAAEGRAASDGAALSGYTPHRRVHAFSEERQTSEEVQRETSSLRIQPGQGELQSMRQHGEPGSSGHEDETPAATMKSGTSSDSAETLKKHYDPGSTDADGASSHSQSAAWQYVIAADSLNTPAEQEDTPLLGKSQWQEQASAPVKLGSNKDDHVPKGNNERASDPDSPIASYRIVQNGSKQTSDCAEPQATAGQGSEEDHVLPPSPSAIGEDCEQVTIREEQPRQACLPSVSCTCITKGCMDLHSFLSIFH